MRCSSNRSHAQGDRGTDHAIATLIIQLFELIQQSTHARANRREQQRSRRLSCN